MVEQVRVNPEEVRGYGNICEGHTLEDFIVSNSGLAKEKENVHGALTDVYKLVYSVYGLMFDFDKGNKQLYLQVAEEDTLSFGFDAANKQLYLVDVDDTGFNLGFDEDTNELYITDDAPPIVHNYSIALDQSSYTTTGSLSVSATLLDDGVAVSGATVSFTGGDSAVTATTNSSGVATATVTFSASGTLTATYSNVSDTASVTVSHNYSLAFSSSSYVATDGSAEVSVTLLDDNVAVTGATISFTGGTSTVTGVTNSSGVATATVSVSATSTITATYQNVTDTCTVTVGPSYIFYDDASVDNSSQYTSYGIQGTSGKVNITFENNAYKITNNTSSGRALLQFGDTVLQNNIKISADIKLGGSTYKQNGMLAFIDKDSRATYSVAGWVQGEKYYRLTEFNGTSELQTTTNEKWTNLSTTGYNHHELVYQNGVVTYTVTNPSSQTKTVSLTLQKSNYIGGKLGLFVEVFSSATHCYIKNIKVESL